MNITLSIDEEIVKKVRKIAIDKNTTLTALVRDYLTSVASADGSRREAYAAKLKKSFRHMSRDMGPRTWTREGIHAR